MRAKTKISILAGMLPLLLVSRTAFAAAQLTIGPAGTAGSMALGVNNFGQLNTTGTGVSTVNGAGGALGLAVYLSAVTGAASHAAGYYDSTSPGCLCEGWGVGGNGAGSGANQVGGITNLTADGFTSSATNIVSTVHMTAGATLKVTQDYHVAAGSPSNTFEDTVTITNTGGATVNNVLYRRVMDWDIPYTEFTEAVTIQGWPATALLHTTDDGFASSVPTLAAPGGIACPVNVNFTDCSPGSDHGALFDFSFGSLAAGASVTFKVFYGAALNEGAALAALGGVGAEVYSLGQSDASGGSFITGTPATYFFGFAGVGGTPVSGVPEPSSLVFLAVPALFALNNLKKKFRKA